jgi:suppressor of ftsI
MILHPANSHRRKKLVDSLDTNDQVKQRRPERPERPVAKRRSLTRRRFLGASRAVLGAASLGAIGYGLDGLIRPGTNLASTHASSLGAVEIGSTPPSVGADLQEPKAYTSKDGFLAIKLEAQPDPESGTGRMAYEGSIPGPTIRIRPGDNLKVALVNSLEQEATNLHVHGFHVSPRDNSDNVFVHVMPGQTFNYDYQVPTNHAPGTYWYHPHQHGHSNAQVLAGLAGAIVIEGGLDDLPGIAGKTERLLVLQGPFQDANNRPSYLVNGQINPVVTIQPGETQRWRLLNASANAFFNLRLSGHKMHQIATDGNPLPNLMTTDTLLLGPGERGDVLVRGEAAGIYELRSLGWSIDIPSQAQPEMTIASVVSTGEPVEPTDFPSSLIPFDDLAGDEIAQSRVITFMEQRTAPAFAIDGLAFVEGVVNQTVKLGTTEEWTIRNESGEWHPFHIHVNDFQIMTTNGQPVAPHFEDTSLLPPNGEIVIRSRFLDYTGKFVYHCHILAHEDAGMMGVVEVVE